MFDSLQIPDRRERFLVGAADVVLAPLSLFRTRMRDDRPARVLLLRLERIGDLLMTHEAIAVARQLWPNAELDLAVGSWNAPLARLMPEVSGIDVLDVPWLSREGNGASWPTLISHARRWRSRRYDLVINFEPDIRSNFLAWHSRAARRAGYWTGGGGAFLTTTLAYDPTSHVAVNAQRLLTHIDPHAAAMPTPKPRLAIDDASRAAALRVLGPAPPGRRLVGLHVSGGRASKQWHLSRFADVGRQLVAQQDVTLILTGGPGDRPMVDAVKAELPAAAVIDAAGALELPTTAALLSRLQVFITADTGPMHLAASVGTPVVALFGPSDPRRYGPRAEHQHIVRVQLPCSPCGQVRLPPERCRGRVPDCMDAITVEAVVAAAQRWLETEPAR